MCIVKVLNRNGKSGGFVSLHSFDFAHAVTEEDLKKNPAIELYAAPCLPQLPEFPVPACYARIVDDKTKKELLQQADGELAADESQRSAALLPSIEEKLADIRISDAGVDADVAVGSTNRSAALLPNIEEKLADIRISDSGVDADVAVGSTNGQSCDPNCETCKCIARLLAVRSVAEVLEEEEPDLFKDLCDFIERC
ncbi:unnamed protein product [Gongylonema pulchrum]|uniref:Uncharacterized protein n=1 Tax=Gongylonema pulchrum TaxID=637853 RepID=A0A3P7QU41_9BILA|nr:unnamed protein product [Gongylonema pulchrum]